VTASGGQRGRPQRRASSPGRGRSDDLGRTERAAAATSVITQRGRRRPRADGEGGRSGREAGEQARRGADGEVGLAVAQEGLAVCLEPWTGEGSGEERERRHVGGQEREAA
jgi:hypothetical protein